MAKYHGSCHCGAVAYDVELELTNLLACNCSICGRSGSILSFVQPSAFTLLKGQDMLTDYLFNKHLIHHQFCKVCGIKSFARGSDGKGNEMVAVNVRCLDGVDANTLEPQKYDGRSL
ncbi:MAG: GFA family protein [Myxococcota bacterium]